MIQSVEAAPASATGPVPERDELPDEALVAAYRGGDTAAFDTLYARHRAPLFRYFRRQVDESTANDLYQEVWMKFINNVSNYESRGRFVAYLFTLAHNAMMDHFRKHPAAQLVDPTDADSPITQAEDPDSDVAEQARTHLLRTRLHEEIAKLPLHQRTAWLIRQETGMSLKQIADITQTTLEGVRSRLRYANDKLKAGMARYV